MIEVKDLSFTYPRAKEKALRELNFSISKGEIFGFLGPSGAGKSTAQKILIGILKAYEGDVHVMGRSIADVKSDYYEDIGVAFEFPNFYNRFTAMENLSLFRSFYKGNTEEPRKLLALLGLEKHAATKVSAFSKGMKMRLNLCRALLNKPQILFLDEPTSGLDPVNAGIVKELLLELKAQGITILITTHHMHAADELCDRVAFIVDGTIRLIDSPRTLRVQHGQRVVKVEYREKGVLQKDEFGLDNIGSCPGFQTLLQEKYIETIHSQDATLEDIFIKLTGRELK
ncbi:ABC transporter ATP-binding protein [Paenibacillus sonchi]|uniref:ABC transporter ATP-binding protein n=1 Tax=Paenibacillus sonchi TaxID=373687 RepID=UPI001E39F099|nr:ABC transporter ATP-binding protein [Paenibacillus sonchi]MCE3200906.1 ABC transporter ATP-binding protein [Paenibacillus sonchi]